MQSLDERRNAMLGRMGRSGVPRPVLAWTAFALGTAVVILIVFLGANQRTPAAQSAGDLAILASALLATVSCAHAAMRRDASSRAWWIMALATFVWTIGQSIWTFFGLTRNHEYPYPSIADAAFIVYAIPAAMALYLFPRPRVSRLAFLRALLDSAVIASAVLFMSWATVLGAMYKAEGQETLVHLTGLAFPVTDIVMVSIVLMLTMRRAPGERLRWVCLGGGLLVLALADSTFVKLTFEGVTGLTGTPLAAGWITAFLLIALAPLVPYGHKRRTDRRLYTLAVELLPYVPVFGAVMVAPIRVGRPGDPFLQAVGLTVLVLTITRQTLMILENINLTRDLESKVAERTAELEGLAAIVNSSADAIVGKTVDGVITSWNPGAERIYGYSASEAIGKHVSFIIPDELRDEEEDLLAAIRAGGETHSFETHRVRIDGSIVPVSLTMSPIRGSEGIHGVATIAQDITERRIAEAELVTAREAAEEASRLKSEFLATMSHEIRTPMNGVIGLTGLLLDTPLEDTQRQYAEGVKGAGEALLTLINDILDFSKLEAGKVDLDPAPFNPRILVEELAVLLAEAAQAKGLELIAYCRPEVPAMLVGDAGRIRQILLNLASNAVKFTPSGEVVISVKVVEQGPADVRVRFEVRDTGIGIDAADHYRLFESFSQADASTTRQYGGTGLGLAISRRLTEVMGGEIGVDSSLGNGSTFWVTLPLAATEPAATPASISPGQLRGLRVLVVDDNASNRLVLKAQLAGWQMIPEAVGEAQQGLERCREAAAAGRPFDIAVLDMVMPHMNGLELAHELSTDIALDSLRIMMLTSTMNVDKAELVAAGVQEWLTKPVRSSEFYDRLMRLVATRPPASAPIVSPVAPVAISQPSRGLILVVEDNEVNQLVARSMVAKLGYKADVVANGSEAVTATVATEYAAVLMDCHMPVMDGFEATKAIRARQDGRRRLPVIAMTAGAMDEDHERCLAAGMDDYLTKPVDMDKLDRVLSRWVPAASKESAVPVLDPARLETLRNLGPVDGFGLLPAAAGAFRGDIQPSLEALRQALDNGGGEDFRQVAHKLKGAAANIGAARASRMCADLERSSSNGVPVDPALLARLETELALVEQALDRTLSVAP
ncbi:PAS domain-containing hybrid sensor histidine kinase/response regulator [Arthrobacter sp. MA-N2]|uniref:PAS domain-containing hybrid sensor histidine kinase/response regulator n=1 Tax=Arthrobacter sp. MA-N2 TaxID=1101188 RepID=UPI0004BB9C68|nr:response regulator [Arthrobacter sp. MA-N2]